MKKKNKLLLLFLIFAQCVVFGQQTGSVISEYMDAPSLANSIIGEPTKQPVTVYLPPSYYKVSAKRYPVIYYLPGYGERIDGYSDVNSTWYSLENSMNYAISQARIKEVIFVIVNGFSVLEGSFYNNSAVTGNWEDFVVKDVVNYMDATYRTLPNANSRALIGLSMGGYGSLNLSMRHPSVFSIGIGECPGVATQLGMMKTSLFDDAKVIHSIISLRGELAKLNRAEAHQKYMDTVAYFRTKGDWITLFSLAYGSAFASNIQINAPYFDYPFTLDANGNLVKDSVVFSSYSNGFGDVDQKIILYRDSLLKLKGYAIDYGTEDYFKWIPEGCVYFDRQLTKASIPHKTWMYTGGHGDAHKSRIENFELPYCDSILIFDTHHFEVGSSY